MKTKVQKWGNSLATRLPKSFADELELLEGSPIELMLEEGAIVIKPDRDKTWDLEALLAGVTDENIHRAWAMETEDADKSDPGDER